MIDNGFLIAGAGPYDSTLSKVGIRSVNLLWILMASRFYVLEAGVHQMDFDDHICPWLTRIASGFESSKVLTRPLLVVIEGFYFGGSSKHSLLSIAASWLNTE